MTTQYRGRSSATVRRARRTLDQDELRFLREMETTHLAGRVTDLYGETRHLKPMGGRAPMGEYLAEVWQRRHFIMRESRNKVLSRTNDTRLGPLWLVLSPILLAAFYWLIFGVVLGVSRGMDNFVAFIIIGILMFQFTSGTLSQSVRCIVSSKAMIKSFSYPRAAIPISLVIRELLAQVLIIVVMMVMILAIPPHVTISTVWLFVPVVLVLQTLINLGIAFFFARFGFKFPDVAQAMSFVVRVLMYASGVIFPVERFLDHPTALAIVKANPVYMILDAYRTILMENTIPDLSTWLGLAAWAVGLLSFGFIYFWQAEEDYARDER
ncbi:ABC transporter permease [Citricoccus sp. NR2]|uniref:ABC transporter permease n=1 Tax=Citricoccus sp. NR2 TaxID=3004095 RepID=UPI0022DE1DCF|nr:ABC transporter permease [Citricoccus sp. NR2]WBL19760.1 ABC transporter permease [Citricoccus sp. NR2]